MESIKVGEYIRSVDGFIRKVTRVNEKGTYEGLCYGAYSLDVSYKNSIGISSKKVKSHSKNIIDLIEVGDYINGGKVVEHAHEKGRLFVSCTYVGGIAFTTFEDYSWELTKNREEDIETIVTKEQFENMEYKL